MNVFEQQLSAAMMGCSSSSPTRTNKRRPKTGRKRGRNSEKQFPGKLHDMMSYVEEHGLDDTISWIRDGTGIQVHDPEGLTKILPIFFGQSKYRSLRRQLNMWHFQRIDSGPDKGGLMHPFFIKDKKSLTAYMSRHVDPNDFQPSPISLNAHQHQQQHTQYSSSTSTTAMIVSNHTTPSTTDDEDSFVQPEDYIMSSSRTGNTIVQPLPLHDGGFCINNTIYDKTSETRVASTSVGLDNDITWGKNVFDTATTGSLQKKQDDSPVVKLGSTFQSSQPNINLASTMVGFEDPASPEMIQSIFDDFP